MSIGRPGEASVRVAKVRSRAESSGGRQLRARPPHDPATARRVPRPRTPRLCVTADRTSRGHLAREAPLLRDDIHPGHRPPPDLSSTGPDVGEDEISHPLRAGAGPLDRSRRGTRPISARNSTDLEPELNRSRRGPGRPAPARSAGADDAGAPGRPSPLRPDTYVHVHRVRSRRSQAFPRLTQVVQRRLLRDGHICTWRVYRLAFLPPMVEAVLEEEPRPERGALRRTDPPARSRREPCSAIF